MGEQRRRVKAARSPKRQEPGDMCVEGQLTRRKRRPAIVRARDGLSAPCRLHSQCSAAIIGSEHGGLHRAGIMVSRVWLSTGGGAATMNGDPETGAAHALPDARALATPFLSLIGFLPPRA